MTGDPGQGQQGGAEGRPPTEEELRAAFEEQMRNIRVEDVLLQTTVTLVNLAARRLGMASEPGQEPAEGRDLGQAKLAIEAVRALLPLCPPDQADPIRQALSQLQMAFAQLSQEGGAPSQGEGQQPPRGGDRQPGPGGGENPAQGGDQAAPGGAQPDADAERAKARAKIWTPPGA